MAKATLKLVFESIMNVIWLPWNNFARHEMKEDTPEEKRRVATVLAVEGWMPEKPLKVVRVSKDDYPRIEDYLSKVWETLVLLKEDEVIKYQGKETKVPMEMVRTCFKNRWMKDGKTVKLPAELYEGVYGFQRGSCLDLANAYLGATSQSPLEKLPCYVMEYSKESERVADCIAENFSQDAIRNDVTGHWPSIIKGAKAYFDSTGKLATLSDITRIVSGGDEKEVGKGQKTFAIITLDVRFPDLHIVEKIVNGGKVVRDGREVDLGQEYGASLSRAKLIEFEQGTRKGAEKSSNPVDVVDFFENPNKGKGTAKAPLKFTAIAKIGDNSPVYLVRYVLQALADGATAPQNIAALDKLAPDLNAMCESIGITKDGKPVFPNS